jgi:hypothetical protein
MEETGRNMSSNSDKLPQMDLAYVGNKGYDALSELMRAMILRTVEDYNSGGELQEEAIFYMEDDDEEYIFSFRSVCLHLNLDPDKTRFAIMNATHRISTRRRAA